MQYQGITFYSFYNFICNAYNAMQYYDFFYQLYDVYCKQYIVHIDFHLFLFCVLFFCF